MATMAPERSRTLHNFSLPPHLNWGVQRLFRCANDQNAPFQPPPSKIRRVEENLIFDLRSEVDKFSATLIKNAEFTHPPPPPPPPPPAAVPETRPRNLRTRRTPPFCVSGGERVKFSVSLSRSEIEDDFIAMTGKRPLRKPKKRPRNVQKQLNTLFPGFELSEVTPDMYKVVENPELCY